ncbi:pyruvate carboxylase [Luteibaculum oceani]|uniref:Pyruvate carboxylase n=1 Tax=Luteibaculum oceani TaxID=1294296 RepID=A0A5C6URM9_9FLAO|nr:pyruvate carboxylase [Luteibaculum oceani]TXC75254.1 pyruvate carboxylase [Luteibaculum oceani]
MKIKKVLVANRGEIAIRIGRACVELNLKTVGIYTYEDRYSQHRYKADESYQIGEDDDPLKPYLDIDEIIRVAKKTQADAIHPGYGFLSENAEFARRCAENDIIFIGPDPEIMDALGDKIAAKKIAKTCGVTIIESSLTELNSVEKALEEGQRIGFPLMLKAAAGGGGRGMRVVRNEQQLEQAYKEATREAKNAFGDGTVFLEKFIEEPKHLEVQILGDRHGNIVHLFERDCSVQRRYQKVVEVAPSLGLKESVRQELYESALKIAQHVGYNNAGTVEFLVDKDQKVYFIEVNPRIQVEHTVTEMVTGIDLVKAQIFIAGGYKLSDTQIKIPNQEAIKVNGFALQCRITTEDPENNFQPDYGIITTYRSAAGFGIRLDAGSLYQGVKISPFFDSMLVKISAHGRSLDGATRRMTRALQEFRIRGVKTNIQFLQNLINHPTFKEGKATVNFIADNPDLFSYRVAQDRATKVLTYLGDVIVNGHPDVKKIDENARFEKPVVPSFEKHAPYPIGTKNKLDELGSDAFCAWLKQENKIQYTDTTFRDAHQSLLATRVRSYDMLKTAESYAKNHPEVFSIEVWGGATFDVCLRFLHENPWRRLRDIRAAVPNILLQMLLRGSNAVGYTAYPDNLIEKFIIHAAENGIDLFRVFDSLNWVKAMEPSLKAIRTKTHGIAEAAISYTGDISNPNKTKYNLAYYKQLTRDLENAGAQIIAIKDMAGLLKPQAVGELISTIQSVSKLPIHLHTHDTSSLQTTTYQNAIAAGVDIVDVALGGLSGMTSQPNFNAVAAMMQGHERENPLNLKKLNEASVYWEKVRTYYYPFESDLKSGTAEVYEHEIPGGQYSNLKPQAIALGLGDRFEEVKKTYATVNKMFGDIVKVTPSSKVVGDMALFMVSNNLSEEDIYEKGENLSFPASVKGFFRGDLGQPHGGFPEKLQSIILRNEKPYTDRPNEHLQPVDFGSEYAEFIKTFQKGFPRDLEMEDFLSYKLYPKVFKDAVENFKRYGNLANLPTKNFFYGLKEGEETIMDIAPGKTVIIELQSVSKANEMGFRTVFFKLNGQTRSLQILDKKLKVEVASNVKVDPNDPKQIGAPLQGKLSQLLVKPGDEVKKNQPLFVLEAMKMESTVSATAAGKVKQVHLSDGAMVMADDLVISLE